MSTKRPWNWWASPWRDSYFSPHIYKRVNSVSEVQPQRGLLGKVGSPFLEFVYTFGFLGMMVFVYYGVPWLRQNYPEQFGWIVAFWTSVREGVTVWFQSLIS